MIIYQEKMVKKRSFANKTVSGSSSTPNIKPEDRKTLEDDLNLLDHSVIREPINVGIKNVHQIITCISDGTKEIKDLILNECNIIYECRVCRNLFRSLANFLAHKRLYCKEHCCEKMVLFDQDWFTKKQEKLIEHEADSLDSESASKMSNPLLDENLNINHKVTSNENFVKTTTCDKSTYVDETILKRYIETSGLITTEERIVKKKRIENLVSKLNSTTTAKPIVDSSIEHVITKNTESVKDSFTTEDTDEFKTIVKNNKNGKQIENEFTAFFKTIFAVKIDFICEYCDVGCTYLSSAIRHLMNIHDMSRISAKKFLIDFGKEHGFSMKEEPNDDCCSRKTDETKIEPVIKIENQNDDFEIIETTNCHHLPSGNLNSPNETNNNHNISESNENRTTVKNKRYETRCSIRKKCFYDCNSQSCFFSKHCPKTIINNDKSIQNHVPDKEIDIEINNDHESKSNGMMINDNFQPPLSSSPLSSASNSDPIDPLSISVKKRTQNLCDRIKKKKMRKIKEFIPILNEHNNESKTCDNNESQQETEKLNFKPTSTVISQSLSSSSSSFGDSNSNGFENFHNDNKDISEDSSLSNLQNNNNNSVDSLDFNLRKIHSQNIIRAKIFDDEIEPVVESTHSPLITKLSLRKFDPDHHHHKNPQKESRLKLHLRTTGSKKCYQIVDT
ncbi:hypothetical protein DERF_006678 [Dermatophagoides farinae]|uniref:C2H2-type domain-containing protein n=1 Tax=Dermatophagoides farinae TaxID=6954 RepID=A0A922HZT2_DERFA|nr:hypothetical protein DERF_006678 [Dermatophagoides farinae]